MTEKDKNSKKVPNLRFPEFIDEWKERKLGDNFNVLMCKRIFADQTSEYGEIPFYKIGTLGAKPDSFISKKLFEEYKTKYNYPKKGEILITCSGTVGKCIVFDGNEAYYQDSNIVWIDNPTLEIKNEFLYYLLYNFDWGKLNSTTITRIYGSDLRNLKLNFPKNKTEQTKIASLLNLVENKIQTQKKTIESLESLIKGVSQKLFTQKLRFKEFTDEWKITTLGEICNFYKGSPLSKSDILEDGNLKCIHYGELFTTYKVVISEVISRTNNNGFKSEIGDILMPSSDVTPLGLATASAILEDNVILGGDINIIRPTIELNSVFLSYLLNYEKKKIIELVSGTTVKHIYSKDLKQIKISIPCKKEQTKIANFLSKISDKIETEKKILELLEQQKKYFLQNMFI